MNITFILTVSTFLEAAEIEECLKQQGIPFTVKEGATEIEGGAPARTHYRRHPTLKLSDLENIYYFYVNNPGTTTHKCAKSLNLGSSTVARVITERHTLSALFKQTYPTKLFSTL